MPLRPLHPCEHGTECVATRARPWLSTSCAPAFWQPASPLPCSPPSLSPAASPLGPPLHMDGSRPRYGKQSFMKKGFQTSAWSLVSRDSRRKPGEAWVGPRLARGSAASQWPSHLTRLCLGVYVCKMGLIVSVP